VGQDFTTAAKWYSAAAKQGYDLAQNNLAALYAAGRGIEQNYQEAMKWYRKAADQGLSLAQNNLGVLYAKGEGVAQDDAEAYFWFNLAAASATPGPIQDNAMSSRDALAAKLTPDQLRAIQRRARDWRPVMPGA